MRRASSILKKHRSADRVYVPSDARDNQYILAEMALSDSLIKLVVGEIDESIEKPYQKFYQKMAVTVFEILEKHGIDHANFVANNKLVRVRYSGEQQVLHTLQQSFFFYCPSHNATFKGYFDGAVRARKVKLLFLATGDELRLNSAKFHQKVHDAVQEISTTIGLAADVIKLRDHQHLTFDIFAKEKGLKDSITHSFRDIAARYQKQGLELDENHTALTYAVVNVPMTRRLLKGTNIDYTADTPFTELYEKIEKAFKDAVEKNGVEHAALLANGASPFIRFDKEEGSDIQGELISLGFDPSRKQNYVRSLWEGETLVDTVRFVFFADDDNKTRKSYGVFANQILETVRDFSDTVNWNRERDDIIVRVHQHINRNV